MQNNKIVIFYSCLSDYILSIFTQFALISDVDLHIVYMDPDQGEAPFVFNLQGKNMFFYKYDQFDEKQLIKFTQEINPKIIVCVGWNYKKYMSVIDEFHKKTKCILTMDNQWLGKPKQYFGLIYSRFFIVNKFHKIWVPGKPQVQYALKLGFKRKNILTGWYVANEKKFALNKPREVIKKQFVFVGRYVDYKGILELHQAFIKLANKIPNDWILNCIGTGPLQGKLPEHSQIKHHGFMQPKELHDFAKEGGVFVLPSHFEPWGLVVQEFALSGFPLLVSDKVGSASQFVTPENGMIFQSKAADSLFEALKIIISKSDAELVAMSCASQNKGGTISYKNWIEVLDFELENEKLKH